MTLRLGFLAVSLLANLALAAVWFVGSESGPANPQSNVPERGPGPSHGEDVSSILAGPDAWRTLTAGSDAEFVARLRQEGFPPHVVAALTTERVRERYAQRLAELRRGAARPYWRTKPWEDGADAATRAARRQIEREIAAEIRSILGHDAETGDRYARSQRARRFGSLPPEKIAQVEAIESDYQDLRAQVRDQAQGMPLAADREQLAFLDQQERADLAAVLAPDELREFDLRGSPAARGLQQRLRNFEPTEAEFRALVSAQLAFDAKYGKDDGTAEARQRRANAQPELQEQFKLVLGPARFADFEITTDASYHSTLALVRRAELPPATAYEAIKVKRETARQAAALEGDRTLSPEARAAQLAALGVEASNRLAVVLGPKAWPEYQKSEGSWLRRYQSPNSKSTPSR